MSRTNINCYFIFVLNSGMVPFLKACAIAAFPVLLISCSRGITDFTLAIEPDIPADQQEAILAAASAWSHAVPVTFRPVVGQCSGLQLQMICVHAATAEQIVAGGICTNPDVVGCTNWVKDIGAEMWLTYNPPLLRGTAMHELGHAQALKHSTTVPQYYGPTEADQRASVMWPDTQGIDYAAPYPGDIRQWDAVN